MRQLHGGNCLAHTFGNLLGPVSGRFRKDDGELLSATPCSQIHFASAEPGKFSAK
jgi:hypothetical protein